MWRKEKREGKTKVIAAELFLVRKDKKVSYSTMMKNEDATNR